MNLGLFARGHRTQYNMNSGRLGEREECVVYPLCSSVSLSPSPARHGLVGSNQIATQPTLASLHIAVFLAPLSSSTPVLLSSHPETLGAEQDEH